MDPTQYTPGLPDEKDFKHHFLMYDAIRNVTNELVFSICKRYKCNAGCQVCYVRDTWASDEAYASMIPTDMPPEVESQILNFFGSFDMVTTMDDLYWLKNKHPQLYAFYQRNSHYFASTAMTDNAFLQQYDIIMNEMNFKTIYEISFSDTFLSKKNGTLVDDIIKKMESMYQKFGLIKLKLVFCNREGEKQEPIVKLIDWAHYHNICVCIHDDILQGNNTLWDFSKADYQGLGYYSQDTAAYQVLGEVVHLQYTSVFHTISDAISVSSMPFYDIMNDGIDDMSKFIYKSLTSKVALYTQYAATIRDKSSKHFKYFSYISSQLEVHEGFTFIPVVILKSWTNLYKTLVAQGWISINPGVFRHTDGDAVVPVFNFKGPPNDT